MKVIKLTPRGYCKGVVRAIQLVKDARKSYPGPIYVLGMIVHNSFVTKALKNLGVETLDTTNANKEELIDSIPGGLLVFTAHGISARLKQRAIDRGLDVLDATCFDVSNTQQLIADYREKGYEIIFIGKQGHPESEAMKANDSAIHIVETVADIEALSISRHLIAVTNQTTMSILDVAHLMNQIQLRYPHAVFCEEVCTATRVRQEAVLKEAQASALLIVGDPKSNNSTRLHHINQNIPKRYMIQSIEELCMSWFAPDDIIAVSSGASTPTYITNQIIQYLEQYQYEDPSTHPKPQIDLTQIL